MIIPNFFSDLVYSSDFLQSIRACSQITQGGIAAVPCLFPKSYDIVCRTMIKENVYVFLFNCVHIIISMPCCSSLLSAS